MMISESTMATFLFFPGPEMPQGGPGGNDETLEWGGCRKAVPLHSEVQKLVEKAGPPERPKAAIDAMLAETWVEKSPTREDEFARSWGFRSFLAMRMCSSPVDGEGKSWHATVLPDGRIILWDEGQLIAIESPAPGQQTGSQ